MIVQIILIAATMAVIVGVIYTAYHLRLEAETRENARKEEARHFRGVLTRTLRESKLSQFSFSELVHKCEIDRREADSIACDIYASLCKKTLSDGVVTDDERKLMERLATALEIDEGASREIEEQARRDKYSDAVVSALADGSISVDEASELETLRRSLGISRIDSQAVAEPHSRDAYVALLKRAVRGGIVSEERKQEINRLKNTLGIADEQAAQFVKTMAMDLYSEVFTMAIQDGIVSQDEKQTLSWLQEEAGLADSVVMTYLQEIRNVERFAEYRDGRLPILKTRKILEGGETCHWEGPCGFRYETARSVLTVTGELIITSKQVLMTSPSKTVAFSPSRIIDLILHPDRLEVTTSSKQGSGHYFVSSPRELEAILSGLARKHKFLLSESYSSAFTRHIPDEVKREVWDRDGGCCVRCSTGGAGSYLEFDHIIPHAKGGANTINNVQLLCRKCNLLKGDRI